MAFSPPSLSVKVVLPSVNVTACSPLPKMPETGSPSPSVSATVKPNSRWLSPPTTVFLTVRLPSRDTLLWVVLVWDSFSPTLTVAVLEMSSTTAASAETFTSKLSVPVAPAACSPSDQVRVRVAAS